MNLIFSVLLVFVAIGVNFAYAQSLDDVNISVLDYDNNHATIQLSWSADSTISQYEVGCVSCIPNMSQNTFDNSITLHEITPLPNSTIVMLYIIAYDSEMEIIAVKQVIVDVVAS